MMIIGSLRNGSSDDKTYICDPWQKGIWDWYETHLLQKMDSLG